MCCNSAGRIFSYNCIDMTQDPFSTLLIALIAAHLVGDFLFQTRSDAERKNEPLILIKHAGLVAATSYVLAGLWSVWLIPAGVFLSHAIVDPVKLVLGKKLNQSVRMQLGLFIADQFIHLVIIVFIAQWVIATAAGEHIYWMGLFGEAYGVVLVVAGGLILITKVGGICIGMIVQPYLNQIQSHAQQNETNSRGLEDGGKIIGYLERFLIYVFIIAGFPLGIGFLITAKSVFRFGEVSNPANRMEAEYIIIGTLMSFAYAVAVGYGVYAVLGVYIVE